jgi:hypothetical protein
MRTLIYVHVSGSKWRAMVEGRWKLLDEVI